MMNPDHSETYVCPICHGRLAAEADDLRCGSCAGRFPLERGIPDFLLEQPDESTDPFLRDVEGFGKLASIYETPIWLPIMLRLLGGRGASSLAELVSYGRGYMANVRGRVLDVATGTGTYGRHIASSERPVIGVDVSTHMLLKGQALARSEGVDGMAFARADAKALPFADTSFSGGLLCGAIHIFPDPAAVLSEIARTLRPGAPLWVTTVVWGKSGLLSHAWARQRMEDNPKMHVFTEAELLQLLGDAGFSDIEITTQGCLASITAVRLRLAA